MLIRTKIPGFLFLMIVASCNTSKTSFFNKRTAHEKYAEGITNAGLQQTQLGSLWFNAASNALQYPVAIVLPYKETGYFPAEKPGASGFIFKMKRGENILINISLTPATGIFFFIELWEVNNGKPSLLTTMDTLNKNMKYTVEKDGQFIIRIQPELLQNVEYTITVSAAPSLAFPVDKSGDPKLISFWGAGRDAGSRKHEGVDIAAKFRTPALAAANGITRVSENTLGGKVIFLVDGNTGNSLYYAHLDSQIATNGQRVTTGEVIGLIGKTGNAIHTIPHLHFGIYTNTGAIDPLAFIDIREKKTPVITASVKQLNTWLRTGVATTLYDGTSKATAVIKIAAGAVMFINAAMANWYRIQLPNGRQGYISSNALTVKKLKDEKINSETRLLASPDIHAPAKALIPKGNVVAVTGIYKNFYLTSYNNVLGWIPQ